MTTPDDQHKATLAANTLKPHDRGRNGCDPTRTAAANDSTLPQVRPDRVDFYSVSLECHAAPAIGCGCRAKPMLARLESEPAISQAWLHRSGTVLAVLWASPTNAAIKTRLVGAALEKENFVAGAPLDNARRQALLEDFSASVNWYRADTVDRLSEEEAEMIAARLLRRMSARAALSDERAQALKRSIAEACVRVLVEDASSSAQMRATRIAHAALDAARGRLDEREMHALMEAVAQGHRPIEGEV